MIKHNDSHMDHGFTAEQWAHIFERFAGRDAFFVETFELPEALGTVMNGLYGPSCGDPPVSLHDVHLETRGNRAWFSRMVDWPARPTRFVRVIAGPRDGHSCVLYTAYGVASIDMPQAPKELGDLSQQITEIMPRYEAARAAGASSVEYREWLHELHELHEQLAVAQVFWDQHALARE